MPAFVAFPLSCCRVLYIRISRFLRLKCSTPPDPCKTEPPMSRSTDRRIYANRDAPHLNTRKGLYPRLPGAPKGYNIILFGGYNVFTKGNRCRSIDGDEIDYCIYYRYVHIIIICNVQVRSVEICISHGVRILVISVEPCDFVIYYTCYDYF